MLGLDLEDLAVDGCSTKAPAGGAAAGRSPVDWGKQGLKRSVVTDGTGVPSHKVRARANRNDAPLLVPTLAGWDRSAGLPEDLTIHLDWGSDRHPTRPCWRSWATRAPWPAGVCRPPSRREPVGWWNVSIVG